MDFDHTTEAAPETAATLYGIDLSAYGPDAGSGPAAAGEAAQPRDWGIDLSEYEEKHQEQPAPPSFSEPDPEKYFPPLAYQVPDDAQAPGEVRHLASARDRTLAISRIADPSRQMNLFARANDIGNMYLLGKQFFSEDSTEIKRIAEETKLPENLVKMMQRHEPDALEARRIAATILAVAGPDSYVAKRFASDPEYVMDWRDDLNELNNLEAAIRGAHGSAARVAVDWFAGAVANTVNDIVVGIPAWGTQVARDLRNDFAPGFAASFDGLDDWMQETYKTTSAVTNRPPPETGDIWLDSGVRPLVQGAGSYLPSFGLGLALKGATIAPATLFGLSEGGSVWRTNREEGVDTLTNLFTSLAVAGIHTAAEKISLDQAFKSPGIGGMWGSVRGSSNTVLARAGRVGRGIAVSGSSESLTEGIETATSLVATPIAKSISLGDPVANIWDTLVDGGGAILESMWGGFGSGGLIGGGIGQSGREITGMWLYAKFQKSGQAIMTAANDLRAKGKSIDEVRTETRNIVHHAIEEKATDLTATAYADAGDIKRKADSLPKAEAERFLQSIQVDPVVLEQAVENGVDIEVKIENILVREGNDQADVLQLFRPTPSMETAAHMVKQLEELKELHDLASNLQHTIEGEIEKNLVPSAIGAFYKDLRAMKKPVAQAKAETALLWAWTKTTAGKRGITPEALLDNLPVRAALHSYIESHPEWVEGIRRRDNPGGAEVDATWTGEDAIGQPAPEAATTTDTATPPIDAGGAGTATGEAVGQPDAAAATPAPDAPAPAPNTEPVDASAKQQSLFDAPAMPLKPGEHRDGLTGLPIIMETTTTEGVGVDTGAFQFKRQSDSKTGVKKNQE
ncbi:MAG: hypothetical protein LIP77_02235, partial [Planctomycetes bacterium]|nr:hypothetical protein [Planctomycetota bacterium]